MGILDILKPKDDAGPKPDQAPKPYTITFSRGPTTPGQPRRVVSYGLTPLGKQKIRALDESDFRFQILTAVEENGPSSLGEISDRVHQSIGKVEHEVLGKEGLVKAGCLKIVGSGGE